MSGTYHANSAAPMVIRDPGQLRGYFAARPSKRGPPVLLGIPGMTQEEAFAASERLNKARLECGCSLAAKTLTATFLIALALLVIVYGPLTWEALIGLPVAIAAALIAAGAAKAIAIATAHSRASNEVARIVSTYSHRE